MGYIKEEKERSLKQVNIYKPSEMNCTPNPGQTGGGVQFNPGRLFSFSFVYSYSSHVARFFYKYIFSNFLNIHIKSNLICCIIKA